MPDEPDQVDTPTRDTGEPEAATSAAPAAEAAPAGAVLRRTRAQRAVLVVNCVIVLACFLGAALVILSTNRFNDRLLVDIDNPAETAAAAAGESGDLAPTETFPPADPEAKNYLITGADSRECIDPTSRFAGGLGEAGGDRSDTIMVMRVDPATKQAAILSFPRDLWVAIGDDEGKINWAYERDEPQQLIQTIWQNFGIGIDHFVQVDFCAFVSVVDALGGVTVPFDHPVRDTSTGLDVPDPGCYTFEGDHALAYVRSRKLEYRDLETGRWRGNGGFGDLDRIARQQDFVRRTLSAALRVGITEPLAAKKLIDAAIGNVITDDNLTINKMLELAGVLRDFDPDTVQTYQIASVSGRERGQSVQIMQLDGENMKAILAVFRGEAALASAPDQVAATPEGTTVASTPDAAATSAPTTSATPGDTAPTTAEPASTPTTTLPVVAPEENAPGRDRAGSLPSKTITCD